MPYQPLTLIMLLQIYLILILYIYHQYIDPCLLVFSNPLKTSHKTPQDQTSPTYPIRTQPYSTCYQIYSIKLSSTYNRPHLVSDGLPRYSSQSLLVDNAPIHFPTANMARRVGLSKN